MKKTNKKNHKNYQFGNKNQNNNNQMKKALELMNKNGFFICNHFGDGYQDANFDPENGWMIGVKKWSDDPRNDLEDLTLATCKFNALFSHTTGNNEKKAEISAFHILAENLISYMIHYDTEKAFEALVVYLGQQMMASKDFYTNLKAGFEEFKNFITNHTEVYKIQYDNVNEIFEEAGKFEVVMNHTYDAIKNHIK